MTVTRYRLPSSVWISVMSPYQATSGAKRGEHPPDQVRCGRMLTLAGQAPSAALDPGGQAQLGHELRDRVVGDLPAGLAQLDADARAAIGATQVVEHLLDPRTANRTRRSSRRVGGRSRHL